MPEPLLLSEQPRPGALALPIADRANVALATGVALAGKPVIVELSSTQRLLASVEALAEAASMGARLPMVVTVPYGDEAGARVDRPVLDTLATLPGLAVVCASTAASADPLTASLLDAGRPAVLLVPRTLGQGPARLAPTRLREGAHATVLAWGAGVDAALDAADTLAREGLELTVVDLVQLHPLPSQAVATWVSATGRLLVAGETAFATRALLLGLQGAFWHLEAPPTACAPNSTAIAAAARETILS